MQSYGSPFSSKSNLAPRVPTSASSSRRSSLLPGMKNVSSRYSISGQSNQSVHVVCKTPYHIVENFGLSLPVLVTEALTFTDRNTVVSVSISSEGWAWFVCGRRLLIWQYKQSLDSIRQRQHVNSQCQELTLPPSDLAHKSDLVCIFIPSGHQVPACIAASPEGMIRYWPSILHPGASVEQSADLQGQECYSLNNIAPSGCILSTTTSSIVLVEPLIQGGRHTLSCRPLRPPHGWLGGIGRRVSSLIFGSLPTAQLTEMKLIKVVTVRGEEVNSKDSWKVYVLAEHSLQKWIVSSGQQDILIFESDISCLIRESFCTSIWETCAGSPNELDVWMLDMQATDGGLMVLCAAVNSSISPQMHYALGKLMTESNSAPQKFSSFVPLKYTSIYRDGGDIEAVEYHFLLSSHGAYIYNQKVVLAALAPNYGDEPDVIEFMSPGDRLLGGAMCGNVPVFFSKIHGLVSLSSSDLAPNDFLNSSISLSDFPAPTEATMSKVSEGVNITMSDLELEELTISDDTYSRLKAAFIYYLKNRNKVQSMTIVQEIFPEESEPLNEIDDVIDTLVIKMSRDLLNDIPAGDPRWAEAKSNAISMGCLNSFQILHQLQDKQKALELLVQFLKDVKLWNRFSAVRIRNIAMATSHIIGEFAEKILAAIALRSLPQEHSTIVEANIKIVLAENNKIVTGGLNHFDLFYREVSEIHKIFQVMTKSSEDIMQSDRRPHEVATMVAGVNSVILSVLQEVIQYRQQNAEMFSPSTPLSPTICEYVPWTSSPGKGGLRDFLTSQQELTLKCGSSVTGEIMLKNQLFDQLVHLIDIILDGHKCHLESIRGVDKFEALLLEYERERTALIQQFLKIEEYERAAILAEKYCDFQILIQICEQTDNKDRLDEYLKKFEQQNFSEYLFNWYIQENKQGRLLEHFRNHKIQHTQQAALSRFLEQHPKLSWILNVYNEDYLKASSTLLSLAKDEKEFLARKKAMLSLGKLAQLASNSASERQDNLVHIESELQLVEHQEDLPEIVLSSLGYDFKKQKVLGPAEIITLYISEENHSVTEYDFKKCLDLLNYIDDEFEKSELRHSIWCRVILQDKWVNEGTISPASIVEKTIFYRLADIICFLGGANDDFLPPIDRLLEAHELGNLKDNSSFQYLLKVAYEHIERTLLTV